MIRALFVDNSGVLVRNSLVDLYQEFAEKYGITKATFRQILHFLSLGPKQTQPLSEYLKTLSVPEAIWEEFVVRFRASEVLNQKLAEFLRQAKTKGIKIIITSNNVSDIGPRLADLGGADIPDLIIASANTGLTKPNPVFWEHALVETKKLLPDLEPSEVLVIDDHPDNLKSAADLGHQTLYYAGNLDAVYNNLCSLLDLPLGSK